LRDQRAGGWCRCSQEGVNEVADICWGVVQYILSQPTLDFRLECGRRSCIIYGYEFKLSCNECRMPYRPTLGGRDVTSIFIPKPQLDQR